MKKKLLIIGLDGLNWDVVSALSKNNIFTYLHNTKDKTPHGVLRSVTPPMTGPAWASFATGMEPASHGCFNSVIPTRDLNTFDAVDSSSIKKETFYEILEQKMGKKLVMINLPMGAPARIQSPMLYSFFSQEGRAYSPANLAKKYKSVRRYSPFPDYMLGFNDLEQTVMQYRRIERQRFEVAQELYSSSWDCFFVLFSLTDWIQHKAYADILNGTAEEYIVDAYRDVDEYVTWFSKQTNHTDTLYLSDHGFQTFTHELYINEWLRKEGMLATKTSLSLSTNEKNGIESMMSYTEKVTVKTGVLRFVLSILMLYPPSFILVGIIARAITRIVPGLRSFIPSQVYDMGLRMDPSGTKVYAPNAQTSSIYINTNTRFANGVVLDKHHDSIRNKLEKKLKRIKYAGSKKAIEEVHFYDRTSREYHAYKLPDLELSERVFINRALYAPNVIEKNDVQWHHPDGIVMASGKHTRKQAEISNASLVDIAPTILAYFGGSKHSSNMQGRVLPLFKTK